MKQVGNIEHIPSPLTISLLTQKSIMQLEFNQQGNQTIMQLEDGVISKIIITRIIILFYIIKGIVS